jgi:hypothetical protein
LDVAAGRRYSANSSVCPMSEVVKSKKGKSLALLPFAEL